MSKSQCRVCEKELFAEPIISLKGMPKAAQYYPTEEEFSQDKGITLEVFSCTACGLVQLASEPVDYYKEVITAATLSPGARAARLAEMEKFVKACGIKGRTCLDVGTAKGEMLDVLKDAGLRPTGIEAGEESIQIAREAGREVIQEFIGDVTTLEQGPFESFISLNFLEHVPFPGEVIRIIHRNTTADAYGYVTVPNLDYLLRTNTHYEFVADHLSYFTSQTIRTAFESNGFDVLDSYLINNDNDVVVMVKKKQPLDIKEGYAQVETLITKLQNLFGEYKQANKKIAVWGAGHRTLALLALSQIDNIEYIIDSAKFKQGKFAPVFHKEIVSPEFMYEDQPDMVLIALPGNYPKEVSKTLKERNLGIATCYLEDNDIVFA